MKINMVTGLSTLSRLITFKNAGGMGTQVPVLAQKLRERGFDVTIDDSRDFDVLHLHNPMPNFIPLIKKTRKEGKPVVIHARHIPELVKGGFKFDRVLYPLFDKYSKWIYNQADVVVCATPYVKRWMEKNGIKRELRVIPNGVDCKKFTFSKKDREDFRKKYGFNNKFIIFSVGLIIPRKGVHDFMEVAKKFGKKNNFQFVWIGSTEPGLEKVDISGTPKNAKFIGHIPFSEMNSIYSGGDAFFFPTYAESYGNALFEAAAAGKVLLIRDIDIYKDWFRDGINCLKGKSVEEYATHIEAVSSDDELRKMLESGAMKLAREQDIEKTVDMLAHLYVNLIK
ncbi:MAG: glycosyltransferase family 4 protein [Candidatus Thermoplasmatota archaeon]|nr:glycosyltransferase family 4 protein [Candidatus Thermoplasmatota archaeon]